MPLTSDAQDVLAICCARAVNAWEEIYDIKIRTSISRQETYSVKEWCYGQHAHDIQHTYRDVWHMHTKQWLCCSPDTHMINVFSSFCTHFHKKHLVEIGKLLVVKALNEDKQVQRVNKVDMHTSSWHWNWPHFFNSINIRPAWGLGNYGSCWSRSPHVGAWPIGPTFGGVADRSHVGAGHA